MTPEVKERWAAALESGEYTQARERLRRYGKQMCCLGVLCDLYDPEGWRIVDSGTWVFIDEEKMPPEEVLERVGLSFEEAEELAGYNDNGESFKTIAQHVRSLPDAEQEETA